jgi:uncharacterized membrane protein
MNDLPFDLEDQTLQPAWRALEQMLQSAPSVRPERGFSRRWLHKWQLAEQRRHARRAIWLGLANGAVTLALFVLLLPSVLPALVQPVTAFTAQVNALISSWTIFAALLDALNHVVQALPLVAFLALAGAALLTVGTAALFFSRMNLIQGEME